MLLGSKQADEKVFWDIEGEGLVSGSRKRLPRLLLDGALRSGARREARPRQLKISRNFPLGAAAT